MLNEFAFEALTKERKKNAFHFSPGDGRGWMLTKALKVSHEWAQTQTLWEKFPVIMLLLPFMLTSEKMEGMFKRFHEMFTLFSCQPFRSLTKYTSRRSDVLLIACGSRITTKCFRVKHFYDKKAKSFRTEKFRSTKNFVVFTIRCIDDTKDTRMIVVLESL